jgi:hypothetical protein
VKKENIAKYFLVKPIITNIYLFSIV